MNRLIAFLVGCALVLAGCGYTGQPEKQWYKPNADYTAADFERDRVSCTDKKTKALAEDCMRQLGWAALGADIGPPIKAPEPTQKSSKTRY